MADRAALRPLDRSLGAADPVRPRRPEAEIATIDDFRAALEARGHRIKRSGKTFSTTCPAHEDRNASLSFGEGDRTELVATCHAGCTFEAILAALGLDVPVATGSDFEARIEATYDYVDEGGKLLFQAVRLRDPKTFRQRRRVAGEWEWKLGDVRRVLFRLPAVRDAAEVGRAVFVVEGEKDVLAMERMGFVATCCPMGAGKWTDDLTAQLAGVPVVIVVPDCDVPGRAHAEAVKEALGRAKIKAKLVELAAERDDGFDVSDFVLEHGDQAEELLRALASAAPAPDRIRLATKTWRDFKAAIGPYDASLDYLGPFLRGGRRVHVIGPIGHGKTTFMAEALSCAINGRDFLGFEGRGGIKGLYVDLEQAPELLAELLVSARFDLDNPNLDVASYEEGLQVDVNERHREMIHGVMDEYQVVVIDPWYRLMAEELSEGMRNVGPILSFLKGLSAQHPKTALVIGFHANEPRPGEHITGLGNASGYKVFQRNCDQAVLFERIAGDRSRVTWAKIRGAKMEQYGAKLGEKWQVEWTRGRGFVRVEKKKPTDELFERGTAEWQDVYDLEQATGWKHSHIRDVANQLVLEGRWESDGGGRGGRGQRKVWRIANVDQTRLETA